MTLKEYLEQEDPVRHPMVVLRRDEIRVWRSIERAGHWLLAVTIETSDPLLAGVTYLLKGTRLWTPDADGNLKSPSCFFVEGTP